MHNVTKRPVKILNFCTQIVCKNYSQCLLKMIAALYTTVSLCYLILRNKTDSKVTHHSVGGKKKEYNSRTFIWNVWENISGRSLVLDLSVPSRMASPISVSCICQQFNQFLHLYRVTRINFYVNFDKIVEQCPMIGNIASRLLENSQWRQTNRKKTDLFDFGKKLKFRTSKRKKWFQNFFRVSRTIFFPVHLMNFKWLIL